MEEKDWKKELAKKEQNLDRIIVHLVKCIILHSQKISEIDELFSSCMRLENELSEVLIAQEFAQVEEVRGSEIKTMLNLRDLLLIKLAIGDLEILEISSEKRIIEQTEEFASEDNLEQKSLFRYFYIIFCDKHSESKRKFRIYVYFDCLKKNINIISSSVSVNGLFVHAEEVEVGRNMSFELKAALDHTLNKVMEIIKKEQVNSLVRVMAQKLENKDLTAEVSIPYTALNDEEEKMLKSGIGLYKSDLYFELHILTNLATGQIEIKCLYKFQDDEETEETPYQKKFANLQEFKEKSSQIVDEIAEKIKGLEGKL